MVPFQQTLVPLLLLQLVVVVFHQAGHHVIETLPNEAGGTRTVNGDPQATSLLLRDAILDLNAAVLTEIC